MDWWWEKWMGWKGVGMDEVEVKRMEERWRGGRKIEEEVEKDVERNEEGV